MQIAGRLLKLRTADGDVDVPVRIFAPKEDASGSWSCRYEIGWPDRKHAMDAGGVDAIQATLMAFYLIGSEIHTSDYHKLGQLFFDAPGGGYGFPVPTTLRDLLQGDDKKFF